VSLEPAADGVVFDFDGAIIDSRTPVRIAVNEALVAHGFGSRPPEQLDRFIGPPVLSAFAELTGEPERSETVAALASTYHAAYERVYLGETELVDGIGPVLHSLELPLALATAKQSEFVAPLLSALGLASRFGVVYAAERSALDEPKQLIVERALRRLGCERPVVVGDTAFDVEAAHANGVRAIGVSWGIGTRDELAQAGADIIVERPAELLTLLSR
jgi:phosphoglycolate phosphatase